MATGFGGVGHEELFADANRGRKGEERGGFMGSKRAQVLNKNAAEQQITAEQLIREATERANVIRVEPKQDIIGEDELQSYQGRKRKEFEDSLRMNKQHIGTWAKYALFEASMKEFARARNIFERALQVDMSNTPLWLKYITFEQKEGFINHARNLFDRVVIHLPRVDQFWYKYAYMEELLGNFGGARTIFERWMEYEPEDNAWTSFVKFEERCGEIDRARRVFERYVSCHCNQAAFMRMTKFEERHHNTDRTRSAYEKAIELLEEELDEKFWVAFAQFEVRQKEFERARAIFKAGLERVVKDRAEDLYQKYVNFEKIYGGQQQIEDVVMQKRRFAYEETLKEKPRDYDTWFDYLRLEEQSGDFASTRELYERAIAQFPPIAQKEYWKRYIYLWYNYALFEETSVQDFPKTRKVYDTILKVTSAKKLCFAKLYKLYAEFELRRANLDQARRIFGRALGECGKPKVFEWYADIELRFGNFDKCRLIYEKLCEKHATEPQGWIRYVEFEESLEEHERCRFLCETALEVVQDMPELVWRKYIDLEIALGDFGKARGLLERLLEKTNHFRVWKTYIEFELETANDLGKMRALFERGLKEFKEQQQSEQRALLLETWLGLERRIAEERGAEESADDDDKMEVDAVEGEKKKKEDWVKKIEDRQPKKKKVRKATGADPDDYEEYIDYIFPEDSAGEKNLKILQAAQAWKAKRLAAQGQGAGAA